MYQDQSKPQLNVHNLIKLVVNADRGEWSQLARGTAFLLYSRGANRYATAFDYAMLESQLSFVVCIVSSMQFYFWMCTNYANVYPLV
jgi:hypothetical protein